MKISYNWLKEYVEFDLTPEELAEALTMAGLEVEEVKPVLPEFKGIVIAKVLSVEKHPNADKLSVCIVDDGQEHMQVICGAPNVAPGQLIPFAPIGTDLPVGFSIKKAKIRGVDSFGMICSEEELGLTDKSDGIWVLSGDFEVGHDLYESMKEDQDYMIDIFITPNRPDAMSMLGIAREVAALVGSSYHEPKISKKEVSDMASDKIIVQIADSEGCPRYAARVIQNVKIGPSPEWMADKLKTCGIRPINNIVDITNYVLLELGQPLHAFDLAHVSGSKIVVRESKKGEKFTTLDEKERDLPPHTVMICDAENPVAIGGIMGGLNSEVSEGTHDILLESAYFNPKRIGASSKRLGLMSEASQRFERGVDPNGTLLACDRAAFLMQELAQGEVLKGIVDKYPEKVIPKEVVVRPSRVNHLLGLDLKAEEIGDIFSRLGIHYDQQRAIIPTYRPDIEREVDLIEEVARLIGFDKIPLKEQSTIIYDTKPNKSENLHNRLKTEILQLGFYETLTNSMVSQQEIKVIGDSGYIKLLNPISDDMNVMRRSLLPGLLKVLCYNINRSAVDMRIFEMGRVFIDTDIKNQPYFLSGLIHGSRKYPGWSNSALPVDFYDVKGIVETFLSKISLDKYEFILYDKTFYFDPDQALNVECNGKVIGRFGKVRDEVVHGFEIDSDVFGFEFSVDEIKDNINQTQLFEIYSRFPFIEKDLALVVDTKVTAHDIESLIRKSGKPLVSDVSVFDLFTGDQLGKSKKSLAFRIRFQSSERTLNEKEVSRIFSKIIVDAERKLDAKLRDQK
jgi:phenylalanyl-tRNA synthetase beta chain